MRVCLGGTFHPFHRGHEAMLRAATEGAGSLFVGVTCGSLSRRRGRDVAPVGERIAAVEAWLRGSGYRGPLEVRPLEDPLGPAAREGFDRIVVSPETVPGARRINAVRRTRGLKPLQVLVVPHVLGQDRLPVSATAVAEGRIDRDGGRLRPVRVAVGSANPVKVEAVRLEFEAFLPRGPQETVPVPVASSVPEQPLGAETLRGARGRARAAREADGEADYAVGVEAGLLRLPGDTDPVDVQACVVLDRAGHATVGWGPAFHYPRWVEERCLEGEMVSDVLGPVADDPQIGGTTGAVGYLSEGHVGRTALTRAAVAMALLPRRRRDLYTVGPPARRPPP